MDSSEIKILILEDNPADAELMQMEMRKAGMAITARVVTDEESFIRELEEFKPDIILSDYDLPTYTGSSALAEVQRRCPDVPFILVTGAVTEERAIEILTSGAKDFVMKNRLNKLVTAVRRTIAEAEEHRARRKAEEEAHAAALYARSLIEASLDPLVTISPSGKILDVNIATEEVTGVSRVHIIGTDFSDYFTDPEKARAGYEKVLSEGSIKDYPLAIRHVSGRITEVLYNASIYRDEKGTVQGVFAAAPDVTALKKAEEESREANRTLEERVKTRTAELEAEVAVRKKIADALQMSERRERERAEELATILDAVPTPVILVHDPDSTHMTGNRSANELLRQQRGSEVSLSAPPEVKPRHFKAVKGGRELKLDELPAQRAARGEQVKDFEFSLVFNNGATRYLLGYGTPLFDKQQRPRGAVNVLVDITERKLAEDALKLNAAIMENVAEGIFLIGLDDNIIKWTNRKFEQLFGYGPGEMVGMHVDKVNAPTERTPTETRTSIVDVLRQAGEFHGEIENIRKDGTHFWCHIHVSLFNHPEFGTVMVSAHTDITERKRAEEALSASRKELQSIIDGTTSLVYAFDLEEKFLIANKALAELLGSSPEQIIGKKRHEFMPKETAEWHEDNDRKVIEQGKALEFEEYGPVRQDGNLITWLTTKFPLRDTQGRIYALGGISADISERKLVENALLASEEKFSKAFRNSPNAITITRLSDGRIIEGNESAYELFGYTHEEVLGKTTAELNIWANLGDRQRLVTGLAAKGFVKNEEFVLQKKDKTPIYVNLSASLITIDNQQCFICSFVDISERKRAEIALLESEKRFRSVLENSRDAIYRLNIQNGFYEYVSPAAKQMLGYSPEELMALDADAAMEMVHPEDISALKAALAQSEETGQAEAEYRQKTRDGGYIWVSNRISITRDATGKTLYRDGIIRNITERKQAEEDLKRKTADLESTVTELDSFTYSVSHDLRAPLRAIDGFSRMLLKDAVDRLDPEDARKLRVISKNSEKMRQLIDDLLKLSRTGRVELRFDQLNIKSVVEDIWREILAGNPDRNMEINIGALPPARGDWTLLHQVFSNLLGNAVKFTKNREKAVIEVTGFNAGECNTYCIRDNGAGFDMKHYDELFEVFQRLHSENQFEGTGVGLAIVKKIIDRHGGRIWAESKYGEGATFYFTLPAVINP